MSLSWFRCVTSRLCGRSPDGVFFLGFGFVGGPRRKHGLGVGVSAKEYYNF